MQLPVKARMGLPERGINYGHPKGWALVRAFCAHLSDSKIQSVVHVAAAAATVRDWDRHEAQPGAPARSEDQQRGHRQRAAPPRLERRGCCRKRQQGSKEFLRAEQPKYNEPTGSTVPRKHLPAEGTQAGKGSR